VTDGEGTVARCTIRSLAGERIVATIGVAERFRPRRPRLVAYQGAAKRGKVDEVIARLAELGVAEARVFDSRRAGARWSGSRKDGLAARWAAIAQSAAKQSRSPWLTVTGPPLRWTQLVEAIAREPLPVVLWEGATDSLRSRLAEAERIALVVGPEGGLEGGEVEELVRVGARPASLGPGVLRTENAAFVAASGILWHFGLIG
jgi:16S rRNA (uracil1498-N3)-methyltransferase